MTLKSILHFILTVTIYFAVYFLITPTPALSPSPDGSGWSYYAEKPDPPIINLAAFPAHIVAGQSSRIIWDVQGAESCISGSSDSAPQEWITPGFKGSMSFAPKNTTTLTLICTGPGGIDIHKIDVKIGNDAIAQKSQPVTMFYTTTVVKKPTGVPTLTPQPFTTSLVTSTPTIVPLVFIPETINDTTPTTPTVSIQNVITTPGIETARVLPLTNPSNDQTVTTPPSLVVNATSIPWKNTAAYDSTKITNISFSPRTSWMIFSRSQPPIINVADGSRITIYNLYGKQVYEGAAGQTISILPMGHYFVESATDRSQFLVIPDDYTTTSFLGSYIPPRNDHAGFAMPGESFRASKLSWGKSYPGDWSKIQPTADTWDWTEADIRMEAAKDINQMLQIASWAPPSWVTDDVLLDKFTEFTATVVRRYTTKYPGKIKYVEVLNEPWCCGSVNPFLDYVSYDKAPEAYAELIKKITTVIKTIDPSLIVFGPSMQRPSMPDYRKLAATTINQDIGGISWHEYRLGRYWPDEIDLINDDVGTRTRVDTQIEEMHSLFPGKKLLVNEIGFSGLSAIGTPYDPAKSGCNEFGLSYGNWRTDTWDVGMNKLTKLVVMLRGGGVDKILTHFNLYNPDCTMIGWETGAPDSRGIKPQTSAFLMVGYWLNNASFVEEKVLNEDKIFLYAWRRANGESIIFAWTVKNQTATLRTIPDASYTDVFGNLVSSVKLTEQPTIIHSTTNSPSSLLGAIENAL